MFLGYHSLIKWIGVLFFEPFSDPYRPRGPLRPGANSWRVINQIRTKLRMPAAAVQVPMGVEDQLGGVVDLVHWKAVYNKGTNE